MNATNPQQTMGNLEYGLLVPRKDIKLITVTGEVELKGSNVDIPLKRPVVITAGNTYDYMGVSSGRRSGLVKIKGIIYKIKGCGIEAAINGRGLYGVGRYGLAGETAPRGGEILPDAINEIERTFDINRILTNNDFPVPYEPVAIMHYDIEFQSDETIGMSDRDIKLSKIADVLKEIIYRPKEKSPVFKMAASIMRIKGDTRLPEIYLQPEKSQDSVSSVAYKFGLMAGAQKRVTTDFYWGGSANVGNYVIFIENDQVLLSMADFEVTRETESINSRQKARHTLQKYEIFLSFFHSGYHFNEVNRTGGKPIPSTRFRKSFRDGFKGGFKNPDKREVLTLDELCEAFDLESEEPSRDEAA